MPSIVVRGKNQRLIGQREQLARDRVVLDAWVAAREIRATRSMDKQNVAGEYAILGQQTYRIRCMPGSMKDPKLLISYLNYLPIFDVDADVRRRRQPMHRHGRPGQFAQLKRPTPMVRMSVRVDDQFQPPPMVSQHGEIAFDLFPQRIDDCGLTGLLRDRQIGLALATIEFAKDHFTAPVAALL